MARSAACPGPACGSPICCTACGLRAEAVYTGHHSPDRAIEGNAPAISRGLPIAKAMAPETLIAFAVNGVPLPYLHGGPLRRRGPGLSRLGLAEMARPRFESATASMTASG